MNERKIGMMTGVVAAVAAGVGMMLPFFTLNLGIASSAGTFFDADPEWYETLWAIAGIAIILLGALVSSRMVLVIGGLVSTCMSVYLLFCMNRVSGVISPAAGFYFYMVGSLAALGAAILVDGNKIVSEDISQDWIE